MRLSPLLALLILSLSRKLARMAVRGDGTSLGKEHPDRMEWHQKYPLENPHSRQRPPNRLGCTSLVTCEERNRSVCSIAWIAPTARFWWKRTVVKSPLERVHRLNSRLQHADHRRYARVRFVFRPKVLVAA